MMSEEVEEKSQEGLMEGMALEELVLFEVERRRMTLYEDEDHACNLVYSCKIK